jgi:hypothetical protein
MTNLIERLRHWAEYHHNADIDEAADEIERLNNICEYARNEIKDQRAEIERLRHYNESVAVCEKHTPDVTNGDCLVCEIERLRKINSERTASKNWYVVENAKLQAVVDAMERGLRTIAGMAESDYIESVALEALSPLETDEDGNPIPSDPADG